MAKNAKILKKIKNFNNIKGVIVVLVVIILVGVGLSVFHTYQRYNAAVDLAEAGPIRSLILQAVSGVQTDAPIDPKTGDIYFPEAHLFVPRSANPSHLHLTYSYDSTSGKDGELAVSNHQLFDQNASRLYAALNAEQVFNAVPKLQACQRGVTLLTAKPRASDVQNKFEQTITLSNGTVLYAYWEKACPELQPTVDVLKNIQAY